MEHILTIPKTMNENEEIYYTANHYVALPHITKDGHINYLNTVRISTGSLIEFIGNPLYEFSLEINSQKVEIINTDHSYENYFIPTFKNKINDLEIERKIFCPETIKGFIYAVKFKAINKINIDASLIYNLEKTTRTIFHTHKLNVINHQEYDEWTNSGVSELQNETGISAMSISGSHGYQVKVSDKIITTFNIDLEKNEEKTIYFYVGVGSEQDGATLNNMDLRRRGGEKLYLDYIKILNDRKINIEDEQLCLIANLNMNYCYYFSITYTIDSDEMVLMTSKNHRYYVSSAYWARDVLLWAFPSILIADSKKALEVLEVVYTKYLKNGAHHALNLNGSILYPGFELDELIAPIIALGHYVKETKDQSILENENIIKGNKYILMELKKWYSDELGLYKTELNPSDDPVQYPYLAYNNGLLIHAFDLLESFGIDVKKENKSLKKSWFKYFVTKINNDEILAWAIDDNKRLEIYDNPPGSLILLPYYNVLSKDSDLYKNTLNYYFSSQNEYYYESLELCGQGCAHAPYPWPKSCCNYILANGKNEKMLNSLKKMKYDNLIACETVDIETGKCKTGAAFATSAGFLAYALKKAYD